MRWKESYAKGVYEALLGRVVVPKKRHVIELEKEVELQDEALRPRPRIVPDADEEEWHDGECVDITHNAFTPRRVR